MTRNLIQEKLEELRAQLRAGKISLSEVNEFLTAVFSDPQNRAVVTRWLLSDNE